MPENGKLFKPLDPLLHSELRLAVMSILLDAGSADFVYLKAETGATSGNLSVQLDKLQQAGYIEVTKGFKGKMPQTVCSITKKDAMLSQRMSKLSGVIFRRNDD